MHTLNIEGMCELTPEHLKSLLQLKGGFAKFVSTTDGQVYILPPDATFDAALDLFQIQVDPKGSISASSFLIADGPDTILVPNIAQEPLISDTVSAIQTMAQPQGINVVDCSDFSRLFGTEQN